MKNNEYTLMMNEHYNLSYDELFEHEQKNNEGLVMKAKYGDTFSIDTGKFTGRSPSDKWIVKNIGKYIFYYFFKYFVINSLYIFLDKKYFYKIY